MNGGELNRQGLTLKQARFVHYYIKTGGNGVVAAQNAGYRSNYQTLGVIASENLKKPRIASELKRRMSKVLTSNEVLEKLSDVAEADVKLNGSDKLKALELLGKSHKLFTDRTETVDLTEHESARTFIANEVADLARRTGKDAEVCEAELQTLFSDSAARNYDPRYDASKHPDIWPSGRSLVAVATVTEAESNAVN